MTKHTVIMALIALSAFAFELPAAAADISCTGAAFSGQGRKAVSAKKAEQSAIDSWNAVARTKFGADTPYNFLASRHLGRGEVQCSKKLGTTQCSAVATACLKTQTRPGCKSDKKGKFAYSIDPKGVERDACIDKDPAIYTSSKPDMNHFKPDCPKGYTLSPRKGQDMCVLN